MKEQKNIPVLPLPELSSLTTKADGAFSCLVFFSIQIPKSGSGLGSKGERQMSAWGCRMSSLLPLLTDSLWGYKSKHDEQSQKGRGKPSSTGIN